MKTKEINNLQRPVTLKTVIYAFVIVIILLAPHFLNVIYPGNEHISLITEGKGWYAYIGVLLAIFGLLDFKYFNTKKNKSSGNGNA